MKGVTVERTETMKYLKMITLGAIMALAAEAAPQTAPSQTDEQAPVAFGPNFIDEDGDGVCDNYASCPGRRGQGYAPNFIDRDGDGVCDNYPTRAQFQGRGYVQQRSPGLGRVGPGYGRGYGRWAGRGRGARSAVDPRGNLGGRGPRR